jgi:hypothetical protein
MYNTGGFVERGAGTPPRTFSVSVAFKGFRDFASCLESALAEGLASVAIKGEGRTEREGFSDGGGRNDLHRIFMENYITYYLLVKINRKYKKGKRIGKVSMIEGSRRQKHRKTSLPIVKGLPLAPPSGPPGISENIPSVPVRLLQVESDCGRVRQPPGAS